MITLDKPLKKEIHWLEISDLGLGYSVCLGKAQLDKLTVTIPDVDGF